MNGIPEATPIILTEAERTELEALARSTKTEYRLRQRARIVLGAAEGVASRAIGREVGCTTGTASKWRVRYAANRLAGLDETGNRGAEPKYTAATGKRIRSLPDAIAQVLGEVVGESGGGARPQERPGRRSRAAGWPAWRCAPRRGGFPARSLSPRMQEAERLRSPAGRKHPR